MKNAFGLVLVFLLGSAPAALGQTSGDAVSVDPTHHHVIMENDYVRVFEVLAATDDKSAMHTHPPTLVISLSKARLRLTAPDDSTSIFDLNPGQVFWLDGAEHSWVILAGEAHVFGVEVKGAKLHQAR